MNEILQQIPWHKKTLWIDEKEQFDNMILYFTIVYLLLAAPESLVEDGPF
jgi:hypothetical protein